MKNKGLAMWWILLISWIIFIFYMSNQSASVSSKQSSLVIDILARININLDSLFGEISTFLIRKMAHFSEYFILYLLSFQVLKYYINIKNSIIYCLFIVLGYAIIDEIHQYFIPGRSMELRDVLIDFSGGLFGATIISILYKINIKKLFRNIK